MEFINIIVSLIPILGPLVFLVILRKSAKVGMSLSMVLIIVFGLLVWKIDLNVIFASIGIGVHNAITIIFILFGAITLVNTLKNTKAIKRINNGFLSVTSDKRVLIILIAFLFGGLIEGASGFGTPATITGPLMVAIGINPFTAAVIALVSDSVSVSFGAVGTPITVGLGEPVIAAIPNYITLIDLFAGTFIPLMVVALYVVISGKYEGKKFKSIIELVPFSIMIGILYTLTAFSVTRLIGYEFTSIISPIVVMILTIFLAKYNILLPKKTEEIIKTKNEMSLLKAWSPYLIVVVLLLVGRMVPFIKEMLLSFKFLNLTNFLNTGIGSKFEILYSPGTVLIIAAIFASFFQGNGFKAYKKAVFDSKDVLINASLALIPTLIMVTIFRYSGINGGDGIGMTTFLAMKLASLFGESWIIGSPILGAIGSFVSGSATVSTLTFGNVQSIVATELGLNVNLVLATQVIGAAIGNMICVHNVVAASSVVGLENEEGNIIRKTIIPAVIYLILVIIVGLIII
ncbi:L-lactate permease [Candidatus Izimaplasma bacterium HR1]|jgi:lactate permease|uniref:L-lactate permease n=1 Tax=Candidatus Izimoplasma sp. HR1 TaxID=1541959 RepID=UPI0004F75433|nr:L-lactate permease [Candidatus Izimaplasma bacterium HR1]